MGPDKKPSGKLVELVAIEPVMTGGARFEPGSKFSVPQAEAQSLVEQGAAELAKPAKPAEPPAA